MQTARARSWTTLHITLMLLGVALCVWVFRAPLMDVLRLAWKDEEQSHILLAPLVMAWLVWIRRARLAYVRVKPSLLGCLIVAAGCVASWFGFKTDTYILWHGGGILAILGMVMSMTGLSIVRQFAPAIVAMGFLLPLPGTIRQAVAIPLQGMATSVTHYFMGLFGYESVQMGNILVINGQQVAVAEACNGMRLVFSLTLVVYAFVFSTPLRPGTRVLLLALSPVIALVANIIRLVPTSIMYGAASVESAEFVHDISGWVMLPVVLLGMMGVLKLLRWMELPVSSYRLASSS